MRQRGNAPLPFPFSPMVVALAALAATGLTARAARPLTNAVVTRATAAQADPEVSAVTALAADSVAGNAVGAYRDMLSAIRDDGLSLARETALEAVLESSDRQQQQFATILLARSRLEAAVPEPARPVTTPLPETTLDNVWSDALIARLVDALRDDELRGLGLGSISNASEAAALMRTLGRRSGGLPADLVAALTAALDSEDRQQRHVAAWLLAEHGVISGAGPPARLLEILVEGLAHDEIHGAAILDNARTFFRLAYELADPRLEPFAASAAAGGDAQARLPAQMLLARLRAGTVQPELAPALLEHMRDDDDRSNQFAALWALHELGPGSIRSLAPDIAKLDWQQSALLTLLAARHGVELEPSSAQVAAWHDHAAEPRPSRIALAAIYVAGPDDAAGGDDVGTAALVTRMRALSPGLRSSGDRLRWASGWFWFLDFESGPLFGWRLATLPV